MVHLCKIILRRFFPFFSKLWFSGLLKEQKWPKMKKNCSSHSVSQEPYIIWLWFLAHICKMMISPTLFIVFSRFWFFGFLGGKRAKNDPQLLISVRHALHLRKCGSYYRDFWYIGVKQRYLKVLLLLLLFCFVYFVFSFSKVQQYNIVNIKILTFLLAHFNSFLNK